MASDRTVPIEQVLGEDWELPEGFHWEYRDGEDGGGTISISNGVTRSEVWPSTRYRRAVGPWEVDRPGGRGHAIVTPAEAARKYWKPEIMPKTMKRLA